ncbi:hypothetical protein RYX36_009636 [Vicia faba]
MEPSPSHSLRQTSKSPPQPSSDLSQYRVQLSPLFLIRTIALTSTLIRTFSLLSTTSSLSSISAYLNSRGFDVELHLLQFCKFCVRQCCYVRESSLVVDRR